MPFEVVARQKAKLRMALTGVSGSGKTYGALLIAHGITGDWGKIALIDTERERGRMYANRQDMPHPTGEYLYSAVYPPYTAQRYIELVHEGAEAVGVDGVVIIDSLSHAWAGEGGILQEKDKITAGMRKPDPFVAWNEAGKIQNSLIDSILASQCHIICTLRSKMAYEVIDTGNAQKRYQKVGLQPIQRDDAEYEFDIVLDILREGHIALASKDVTFLDRYGEVITPDLGKQLKDWLDVGTSPPRCEKCHKRITNSIKRTAQQLIDGSIAQFGKPLCLQCALNETKLSANKSASIENLEGTLDNKTS